MTGTGDSRSWSRSLTVETTDGQDAVRADLLGAISELTMSALRAGGATRVSSGCSARKGSHRLKVEWTVKSDWWIAGRPAPAAVGVAVDEGAIRRGTGRCRGWCASRARPRLDDVQRLLPRAASGGGAPCRSKSEIAASDLQIGDGPGLVHRRDGDRPSSGPAISPKSKAASSWRPGLVAVGRGAAGLAEAVVGDGLVAVLQLMADHGAREAHANRAARRGPAARLAEPGLCRRDAAGCANQQHLAR